MIRTVERFMDFEFVAAQQLPGVPAGHRAARLHGHTFQLRVRWRGAIDPDRDWLIDPADMCARVENVLAAVDHHYLNDLPGLENPSTENLARYLKDRLAAVLAGGLVTVELWENQDVGCLAS